MINPTSKFKRLFEELSRREVSILMRVISNRLPLKDFYYKIKRSDSPDCVECKCTENANHYLFRCKRYHVQRNRMLVKVGNCWEDFNRKKHFNVRHFIYGCMMKPPKNEPRTIDDKTQVMFWQKLCEFVIETGRFTSIFGELGRAKVKEK